jgi:hypothetical protein
MAIVTAMAIMVSAAQKKKCLQAAIILARRW